MDIIIIVLFWGIAIFLNLLGEILDNDVIRYYSKPFLMPLLLSIYWLKGWVVSDLIAISLTLAFLGDVFLLFPKIKTTFMLGLGSFLACHIFYIIYFIQADHFPVGIPWFFWAITLIYAAVGVLIYSKLHKYLNEMKIPVIVYIVTILSMSFICAARGFRFTGTAFWLPLIGSILFIISDTILAFNAFRKPIKFAGLFVMATYIAAQVLIIFGILTDQN